MPLHRANFDVAAETTQEQIHRSKCIILKGTKRD
jgi:hypothetical protein